MSKNPLLHINPTGLDLVKETTPHEVSEWLINRMGGREEFPPRILDELTNRYDPERHLAPLLNAKMPGDTLWTCQTQKVGPLYGNAGICLVRDGLPILYLRVIDY